MAADNFENVLRQLCRDAGIEDESRLLEDRVLVLDEMPVRIEHLEDLDALQLRCDLGPGPQDHHGNFARLLLACNLDSFEAGHPSFAMDPETGVVVLSLSVALASLDHENSLHCLLTDSLPSVIDTWESVLEDFADPGFAVQPSL